MVASGKESTTPSIAQPDLPTVTAVMLGFGAEEYLSEAVDAVLAAVGVILDLVLVDNGVDGGTERFEGRDRLRIVRPLNNLGFAGGCIAGALEATGELLVLVNSDAIVRPDAFAEMATVLEQDRVEMVMAGIRLAERPEIVNSAGNPLHISGLSWAGGLGQVAGPATGAVEVTGASGACLMLRRAWWIALDGFDEHYFAYLEDTEMSLRTWRLGRRVMMAPAAVVLHHYEFSRTPSKFYLLERNRLILVLTLWPTRALFLLAPVLLGVEIAVTVLAITQGWGREKARGWRWLFGNREWLLGRRRLLAGERTVPDREWMSRLTVDIDPAVMSLPAPVRRLSTAVLGTYWRLARRLL